jgi:glycosyltransferase involved in cell wall biosynthesis
MKVALIHDHLVQDGGAENMLKVFQDMFPDAPTFTLLYNKKAVSKDFLNKDIRTSFLQRMPFALKKYQWYLPFMPSATESYDLTEFDLVISSSSAFAKGVITMPKTKHICYCHTPTRYLWTDTHSYVSNLRLPKFIKRILPLVLSRLRVWDQLAGDRPDFYLANSKTVQDRITKYYRRDSEILYPPVDLDAFNPKEKPGGDYFLAGGRLVAYKRFDLVIKAFNRLGIPLKIFGIGPELDNLKKLARKNIELMGYVSDEERAELYRGAKAFINPQVEDFGITPVEAMASGTPVIALKAGGALETVVEGKTGLFFSDQRWEEISDLVIRFKPENFDPKVLHQHAMSFSVPTFSHKLRTIIEQVTKQRT